MKVDKILFFGKLPPPYTGENVVSESILKLLGNNFDISVINTAGTIEKKEGFIKKIVYFTNQTIHIIKSFLQVRKTVRKQQYQFLYFSGSSSTFGRLSDCLLIWLTRKHAGKTICHLHRGNYKDNFSSGLFFNAGKFFAANIDLFIFLSKNLSNDLHGYIPAEKRVVLPNPVDKAVLLTDEEYDGKCSMMAKRENFTITYLSNFILSKGYMDLIAAIKLLPEHLKQKLTVRFIGAWIDAETEKNIFFNEIESKELSGIVEYIGPTRDRARIKALLTDSDIFCLPSYYPLEAQPVSIIEAMNAGNAIISTRHASIPEYVTHGKVGLLVEKRNIQELAAAIENLCNRHTIQMFSANARKEFLSNFHEEKVKKMLLEIFE
jgi:glycosyltransferase involved in cell wall biosynthesis